MKDNVIFVESLGLRLKVIAGNTAYFYCPWDGGGSLCVDTHAPIWYCHHVDHPSDIKTGGHLQLLEKLIHGKNNDLDLNLRLKNLDKPKRKNEDDDTKIVRLSDLKIEDFFELKRASGCTYFKNSGFEEEVVDIWDIKRTLLFIVIPVKDKKGEVKGIISRAILSNQEPRYQYNKDFPKKKLLFGMNNYEEKDLTIIVEGWSDCAKSHQNGYKNTLAILGSSIGEMQIKELRKLSGNVLILLDNENKTIKATRKIADELVDMNVFVPDKRLYVSSDPGKMGKEELDNLVENKIPFLKAKIGGLFK